MLKDELTDVASAKEQLQKANDAAASFSRMLVAQAIEFEGIDGPQCGGPQGDLNWSYELRHKLSDIASAATGLEELLRTWGAETFQAMDRLDNAYKSLVGDGRLAESGADTEVASEDQAEDDEII